MKSILLTGFILATLTSNSQDSSFQLKDYKYRTLGFKALELGLSFSGSYNTTNVNDVNAYQYNGTSIGPAYANYYHIRSTDRKLQQMTLSLSTEFTANFRKDASEKSDLKHFENRAIWDQQTRIYQANQWFFEWGNQLMESLQTDNEKTPAERTRKFSGFVENTVTIGIGKGRIEWVQDAQMALYILQDLTSQKLMERKASVEESNAFAQLITDINNRRVFDSRKKRIYELSRIDSFLKSTGLVTQTDIRHFTSVNDNWAFAIIPSRQSGASWYARLQPGASVYIDRLKHNLANPLTSTQENTIFLGFSPIIGYENYRPVSLKWQRNFGYSVYYQGTQLYKQNKYIVGSIETISKINSYSANWNFSSFYEVVYFPNTRTQFNTRLGFYSSYYNQKNWTIVPSLNLSANYFLGYRTYLTGYINVLCIYKQFNDVVNNFRTNYLYSNFALHLSHFIF